MSEVSERGARGGCVAVLDSEVGGGGWVGGVAVLEGGPVAVGDVLFSTVRGAVVDVWDGGREEGEVAMAESRRGARRVLPAPVWPRTSTARGRNRHCEPDGESAGSLGRV